MMTLTYRDILDTGNAAQETINEADKAVRMAVMLIVGRLRIAQVDQYDLTALKRELQDFNAATGKWKVKK